MFAVIKTGGKQYRVSEGQLLSIEKLEGKAQGAKLTFAALLVSDKATKVGTPLVSGAKVEASVVEVGRGEKIIIRKYKPKVRYRRKAGHRQPFTKIKIEKIVA